MHIVTDARALFTRMKKDGVPCLQDAPVEMRNGRFWFQFQDPSGNILDVLDVDPAKK